MQITPYTYSYVSKKQTKKILPGLMNKWTVL